MPISDFDGPYEKEEYACPRQMVTTDVEQLDVGDIVRLKNSGTAYVVIEPFANSPNASRRALAIRTISVSNACEWMLIRKVNPPARYL